MSLTAIIVDDEKHSREALTKLIEEFCQETTVLTTANSVAEAIDKIKSNKPDVVFLDINMPAMNGWEFLTEFSKLDQKVTADIKVILLSTSSNPDDVRASAKNHSVDDFINKPLSMDLLDDGLKNHF